VLASTQETPNGHWSSRWIGESRWGRAWCSQWFRSRHGRPVLAFAKETPARELFVPLNRNCQWCHMSLVSNMFQNAHRGSSVWHHERDATESRDVPLYWASGGATAVVPRMVPELRHVQVLASTQETPRSEFVVR